MARILKHSFPSAQISMLIQRYTTEIVKLDPNIDQILYYDDDQKPLSVNALTTLLIHGQFDAVFHTHARFRLALTSWLAGIPIRIGTGYRWYSFLFNRRLFEHRKDAVFHELEYNIHLLRLLGCDTGAVDIQPELPVVPEARAAVQQRLLSRGISPEDPMVIIHPGSGKSARDWKAEYFGELARRLIANAHVKVIVTGGSQERILVENVARAAGAGVFPMAGETNLTEYCALVSMARLFIANSTGPIHMAAAVGTPVIGLYPQVPVLSAARWGPYTRKKTIVTPRGKPINCKKCRGRRYGECECMNSITVDEVLDASLKYLINESTS